MTLLMRHYENYCNFRPIHSCNAEFYQIKFNQIKEYLFCIKKTSSYKSMKVQVIAYIGES